MIAASFFLFFISLVTIAYCSYLIGENKGRDKQHRIEVVRILAMYSKVLIEVNDGTDLDTIICRIEKRFEDEG